MWVNLFPDDIPIQDDQQQQNENAPLDSITEEQEDNDKTKSKAVSALKHLPKHLSGLAKKHKDKSKHAIQGDQSVEMNSTLDGIMDINTNNDIGHNAVHVSAV